MKFEVWIPTLPPTTNTAYRISRSRMYISKEGNDWAEKAALVIGTKHSKDPYEWKGRDLQVSFTFYGIHPLRWDVDGRIKLALDTLAAKLGFDDRNVWQVYARKQKGPEGVRIILEEYSPFHLPPNPPPQVSPAQILPN